MVAVVVEAASTRGESICGVILNAPVFSRRNVVGLLRDEGGRCRCDSNLEIVALQCLPGLVPKQACYHAFQCLLLAGCEPDEAQQIQVLLKQKCRCHPWVQYLNICADGAPGQAAPWLRRAREFLEAPITCVGVLCSGRRRACRKLQLCMSDLLSA